MTLKDQVRQSNEAIAVAIIKIAELDTVLKKRNEATLAMISDNQYIAGHLDKARERVERLEKSCQE
jgi:hypothetical protein